MNKRRDILRSVRRPKPRRLKALGRNWMIPVCAALLLVSVWEFCVRLDAMYKPIKMFFDLAVGEGIPIDTAMKYFDWSIFEPPLWLAACALMSLLALFLCRRPIGSMLLIPLCGALAAYGLMREGTFLTDLWRLVQPALLLVMTAFGLLNLLTYPPRRRRFLADRDKLYHPPHDLSPRMNDAPRLSGISYPIRNAPEKKHRHRDHIA